MDGRMLHTVDEEGRPTGIRSRVDIHKEGLLHNEVHVWFYTPAGEIIFQHRGKDKDTAPDLLDATVGGHVEIGETIVQAALKEIEEETGLRVAENDLYPLGVLTNGGIATGKGGINNARWNVFAYRFEGEIEDLRIEDGLSEGFERWPIESLEQLPPEHAQRFISDFLKPEWLDIFKQIAALV